jgi:phospholipid/cholesterol/gamma-HCH transport system permease protein
VTFITLRELGILLAAVMIVGRSGSSFTAQIGAMVMHEEVDAMRSLALDPIEILVVPRVLALLIIMPIMTFFADAVAMFGAILICWIDLGITPAAFIERAREVATGWDVGVGFVKAPVFGMIIALVGCYEGLKVTGSAESVGQQTTRSVVEAIFMILVLDAFFAVFFTAIGI